MITKSDISLFETGYFVPLRICDSYIELQSINSGQCWIVQKLRNRQGVMLHNKEDLDSDSYREHRHCCTIQDALDEIMRHDEYILLK